MVETNGLEGLGLRHAHDDVLFGAIGGSRSSSSRDVPLGFVGLQNLTHPNAKTTTFSHRLIRNVVLQYGYVGNDPNMPCLIPERRQWGRRLEK